MSTLRGRLRAVRAQSMYTHVALIRGINVGGKQLLSMSALREMLNALGFDDARTLLQSGNVVFNGGRRRSEKSLQTLLEKETAKRFQLNVDVIVRTAEQFRRAIDRNPFAIEAKRDPSHMLLMFFKSDVDVNAVETLRASIAGSERISADAQHLYLVYPDGIGTSKLTGARIEKTLSARGTARNWNTVMKLAALLSSDD